MTSQKRTTLLSAIVVILGFILVFLPPQIPFQLAKQLIAGVGGGLAVLLQLVLLKTTKEKTPSYILLAVSVLTILLMLLSY